jgi:regulatory protein
VIRIISVDALDQKRFRVVLDGMEGLVLYGGELSRFGIREGALLAEEAYEELLDTVIKPRARERLLRALQVSDKTEQELRLLLAREGYPREAAEDAIAMAYRYHYIDDEAYALRYVEQVGKKKSRRQLSAQMQRKGFPREIIEALLEKKGLRPGEKADDRQYARLMAMLARRGYSWQQISEAMEEWTDTDNVYP